MDIICFIKQVPDTTDVKIDPKTGTLIREGVPSIINPEDKNAIEAAVQLKEKHGGKITVVSMGPPQAEDAMREAYAMGVDECILLCDRAFAGADTLATSYTLAMAVKHIGKFDLVISGRQAIDGDTAQIGPQVAEFLKLPQVTYARDIKVDGKKVIVERVLEDGYEVIEAQMPCLVTCIKEMNKPRYPTVSRILKACKELKIPYMTAAQINCEKSRIGLEGSATGVKRTFAPEPQGLGVQLKGKTEDVVKQLVKHLENDNIINR
jgi:electron transfer flavoprotein alpha/beta subunit